MLEAVPGVIASAGVIAEVERIAAVVLIVSNSLRMSALLGFWFEPCVVRPLRTSLDIRTFDPISPESRVVATFI
jgi:hypothetical protein